jgi:hypothetical protein
MVRPVQSRDGTTPRTRTRHCTVHRHVLSEVKSNHNEERVFSVTHLSRGPTSSGKRRQTMLLMPLSTALKDQESLLDGDKGSTEPSGISVRRRRARTALARRFTVERDVKGESLHVNRSRRLEAYRVQAAAQLVLAVELPIDCVFLCVSLTRSGPCQTASRSNQRAWYAPWDWS